MPVRRRAPGQHDVGLGTERDSRAGQSRCVGRLPALARVQRIGGVAQLDLRERHEGRQRGAGHERQAGERAQRRGQAPRGGRARRGRQRHAGGGEQPHRHGGHLPAPVDAGVQQPDAGGDEQRDPRCVARAGAPRDRREDAAECGDEQREPDDAELGQRLER